MKTATTNGRTRGEARRTNGQFVESPPGARHILGAPLSHLPTRRTRRFQFHLFALVALLAASLVTAPRSLSAQTAASSSATAATHWSLAVRAGAAETVAALMGRQVVP